MVVLPQPGGPHRIIEASRCAATMRPIGASGAEQMVLAHHLVERFAAAAGRRAGAAPAARTGSIIAARSP